MNLFVGLFWLLFTYSIVILGGTMHTSGANPPRTQLFLLNSLLIQNNKGSKEKDITTLFSWLTWLVAAWPCHWFAVCFDSHGITWLKILHCKSFTVRKGFVCSVWVVNLWSISINKLRINFNHRKYIKYTLI